MYYLTVGLGALLFTFCGAFGSAAEEFLPFDEAAKDSTFLEFRGSLREIVRSRNLERLREVMDPAILTSFGGSGGIEEAVQEFRSDPSLWEEFDRILSNGGRFADPTTFIAPYWYFMEASEPESVAVIVGESVNVRAEPSMNASVLASLSYETIKLEGDDAWENPEWVRVRTTDGQVGFVSGRWIASSFDRRATFQKTAGGWRLDAFVAGD